jgi:hypothetical protein
LNFHKSLKTSINGPIASPQVMILNRDKDELTHLLKKSYGFFNRLCQSCVDAENLRTKLSAIKTVAHFQNKLHQKSTLVFIINQDCPLFIGD